MNGARPLKRVVQKYIVNPLSEKILSGNSTRRHGGGGSHGEGLIEIVKHCSPRRAVNSTAGGTKGAPAIVPAPLMMLREENDFRTFGHPSRTILHESTTSSRAHRPWRCWDIPEECVETKPRRDVEALASGWQILEKGGTAVDAVEHAVMSMGR